MTDFSFLIRNTSSAEVGLPAPVSRTLAVSQTITTTVTDPLAITKGAVFIDLVKNKLIEITEVGNPTEAPEPPALPVTGVAGPPGPQGLQGPEGPEGPEGSFSGVLSTFATAVTVTGTETIASASSFLLLSVSGTPVIEGISGGTDGKRVVLANTTVTTITVQDDSTSAASDAHKIFTGTGSNYSLLTNQTIEVIYDETATRWRKLT